MSDESFKGKRTLVTGASQGIGRAIAVELALRGAEVFALAFPEAGLPELVAEFPSITPVVCDLSNWAETEKAVQKLLPIQLLVNNAGVMYTQPFLEITEADFNKMFDVNAKPMISVTKTVAADLISRNEKGAVVNISSITSVIGYADCAVYSSSKAAVSSLTRSMAVELGPKGIRANAVCPGTVNTPLARIHMGPNMEAFNKSIAASVPLGRYAETSEIAPLVRFLLSDEAAMVNGVTILVDGGQTAAAPSVSFSN